MTVDSVRPLFDKSTLPADSAKIIENFDEILQKVRPLNSRQLHQLPDNIKSLSHQLTDERASRRLGYMNDTVQLISYVRYYTWWNLVRLTRLLSNLPEESFPSENRGKKISAKTDDKTEAGKSAQIICLDLGSGPLTVVTALWLARPELRELPLAWYCLDVSAGSMVLGEDIFLSVVARTGGEPWKITKVKGSFGTNIRQKADFVTCANMLNELDQVSDMPPEFQSKKYFSQFCAYSAQNAKFLLVEPGVPKSSRTLSLLRERFIKNGSEIAAPCPHSGGCPMSGFKAYTGSKHKWCNFAFSTEDAPAGLQKLSERAKLPKERATLSFLSVIPKKADKSGKNNHKTDFSCRIASDEFRLPHGKSGFYACSELGLTLLQTATQGKYHSGDLVTVLKSGENGEAKKISGNKGDYFAGNYAQQNRAKKTPESSGGQKRDEKSGAVIIEI